MEEELYLHPVKISEIDAEKITLEYGSSINSLVTIDLLLTISRIPGLGTIPVTEVFIKPFIFNPGVGYTTSDRSIRHTECRPIGGSIGVDCFLPDGRKGSVYLVESFHLEENHHNPELWGYDFNGKPFSTKNIELHCSIPLNKPLWVKLTIGDMIIEDKYESNDKVQRDPPVPQHL